MSVRVFENKDIAIQYAMYRPDYVDKTYQTICDFYMQGMSKACDFGLAVDVGCGNGQSSRPLCKLFRQVIACDISAEQITHAKVDEPNLTFKVANGEDLGFLHDESVDLVTTAAALHWFHGEAFYKEVDRVLKPGGVFAAYCYGLISIKDDKQGDLALQRLEFCDGLSASAKQRRDLAVVNHYRDIKIPFQEQLRIDTGELNIIKQMSVDEIVGYMSSLSTWDTFKAQNPDTHELDNLKDRLKEIYGERDALVEWPVFMLLGRKSRLSS